MIINKKKQHWEMSNPTRRPLMEEFFSLVCVAMEKIEKWLYSFNLSNNRVKSNVELFHCESCKIGHPPNSVLINVRMEVIPSSSICSSSRQELYNRRLLTIAGNSSSLSGGGVERSSIENNLKNFEEFSTYQQWFFLILLRVLGNDYEYWLLSRMDRWIN